jgi:hypothetical protein
MTAAVTSGNSEGCSITNLSAVIYLWFNNNVSSSNYRASNDRIIKNHKSERTWKEAIRPNLRYYPGICLRKTTTNLRKDSLSV